jgi:hypothetical protein
MFVALQSRPGKFHPKSLTDPDVILSHHPARVIAPRLPPFAEPRAPPGLTQLAMFNGDDLPLFSTGITPLHNYYEAVRPSPEHRYLRLEPLRLFP